jgi:hypothetical protein
MPFDAMRRMLPLHCLALPHLSWPKLKQEAAPPGSFQLGGLAGDQAHPQAGNSSTSPVSHLLRVIPFALSTFRPLSRALRIVDLRLFVMTLSSAYGQRH